MVVDEGLTVRTAGEAATPDWTTPSDQLTVQGAMPASAAWICVELPWQIVVVPDTTAVGAAFMVVLALEELLASDGSLVGEETEAVLVCDPGVERALRITAIVGAAPTARVGRVQVTVVVPVHVQPEPVAETRVAPAGIVSVTVTEAASEGPALEALKVYVTGWPAQAGSGESV